MNIIDLFLAFKFNPSLLNSFNVTSGDKALYSWYGAYSFRVYIGMGNKDRPYKHRNDLLSRSLNNNWSIIIIGNLSQESAKVLESFFIWYGTQTMSLSPIKCEKAKFGCLLNKKREKSYEKYIPYKLLNGNYIECIIGGETDCNWW